jgi:hypothetical protein
MLPASAFGKKKTEPLSHVKRKLSAMLSESVFIIASYAAQIDLSF